MSEILLNRQALNDADDLKKVSSVAEYPLGFEVETIDENKNLRKYIYVKSGATISAKNVVMVNPGFVATTLSTSAFAKLTGVANVAIASGSFGFIQIKGQTVAVSASTTTKDHYTKLITALATFADSSSVVASTNAIINETLEEAGDCSITLLGISSEVAAS